MEILAAILWVFIIGLAIESKIKSRRERKHNLNTLMNMWIDLDHDFKHFNNT